MIYRSNPMPLVATTSHPKQKKFVDSFACKIKE